MFFVVHLLVLHIRNIQNFMLCELILHNISRCKINARIKYNVIDMHDKRKSKHMRLKLFFHDYIIEGIRKYKNMLLM